MRFVNVKELKNRVSEVLHSTEDGQDVFVTFRGKPRFIIHWLGDLDLEDYILAYHPDFVRRGEEAHRQYMRGETTSLDTLREKTKRELGKIQRRSHPKS